MNAFFTDCYGDRVLVEVVRYDRRTAVIRAEKPFGVRNKGMNARWTRSAVVPVSRLEMHHDPDCKYYENLMRTRAAEYMRLVGKEAAYREVSALPEMTYQELAEWYGKKLNEFHTQSVAQEA